MINILFYIAVWLLCIYNMYQISDIHIEEIKEVNVSIFLIVIILFAPIFLCYQIFNAFIKRALENDITLFTIHLQKDDNSDGKE